MFSHFLRKQNILLWSFFVPAHIPNNEFLDYLKYIVFQPLKILYFNIYQTKCFHLQREGSHQDRLHPKLSLLHSALTLDGNTYWHLYGYLSVILQEHSYNLAKNNVLIQQQLMDLLLHHAFQLRLGKAHPNYQVTIVRFLKQVRSGNKSCQESCNVI